MNTIVAGYDGSPDSGTAVRWAAAEARARDANLVVCSAWDPVLVGDSVAREHGAEILRRGLGCAQAMLGAARVESMLVHGSPVSALREAGAAAEMVVVGARGQGGLPGLLLGSVPAQLAGHCPVPLVVMRGRLANVQFGPVVAGVDGSAGAALAVAFALREAELHDLPLVAVCGLADAPGSLAGSRRVEEDFGDLMIRLEKEHPGVLVQRDVLPGSARTSLLRIVASTRAA
ncbi:MAG TPA: universal stress protein, partial [Streptosporangiaceae bacterium]|nr:universal stress protein [Streptosporangiaceae bacterium]